MNFLKKSKIDGGFGICLGFMISVILSFIFFLLLYFIVNVIAVYFIVIDFTIELLFQFFH